MKRAHLNSPDSRGSVVEDDGMSQTSKKMRMPPQTAGIVHKVSLENFLCHDKLEVEFNNQINFIIGKNGSGKSAILTGIVVALGEKASATSRGNKLSDFVKTGKSKAVVQVTLVNKGEGAYQRDVFGDFITIERSISADRARGGGYKLLNERGGVVSSKRSDLDRMLAKMNLQVDNPVCILNQETAKNFLHGNDATAKYTLFERATQLDVIWSGYRSADEQLQHALSCLKDKIQSLEMLYAEVKKWKVKKDWFEALNEIHDRKAQLENAIAWAQVEDLEKKAEVAVNQLNDHDAKIGRYNKGIDDHKAKLLQLEETYRTRTEMAAGSADEIRSKRAAVAEIEAQLAELKDKLSKNAGEVRQLEIEKRRLENSRGELIKSIEEKKKANGDSEWARRREHQLAELESLQEHQVGLVAQRSVSDHQVGQLRGALTQLRNESGAARSECSRLQRDLDAKTKRLSELRSAGMNSYAVYGRWVPELLKDIERTNFRGPKPKGPLGAYIKVKDPEWAAVVENFFGAGTLHSFICSNDTDNKLLDALLQQRCHGNKPKIITSSMSGQGHNVWNHKVHCDQEMNNRGMHCLLDMLIIEDPDVANILIDLNHIEEVMLIRDDRDARVCLSEASRVPPNCRTAITKQCNRYFPDPNYRCYSSNVRGNPAARYLQASVEDAIRNLEYEIDGAQQEIDRAQANFQALNHQAQLNQEQLRAEEKRLTEIRSQLSVVEGKIKALDSEIKSDVPPTADVAALEEDLLDIEEKLCKLESEKQAKKEPLEELNQKIRELKQAKTEQDRMVAALVAEADPARESLRKNENKQREIKHAIRELEGKLATLQSTRKNIEAECRAAKERVESKTAEVERMSPRVPVTKSLKSLTTELKQITEHMMAQEKELGSREIVYQEYRRHFEAHETARAEVSNAQQALKKMKIMAKKRKQFIHKFRESIMTRTHHMFQHLLKTRDFEGGIEFDTNQKTLVLKAIPPGRQDPVSQQTPSRSGRPGGRANSDLRSLSGGERSYATICFILSLWDAIESPFRILDEFDVFMDHVNRSISMKLLIDEALENAGRQFIFLTPLGLDKQQLRDDGNGNQLKDALSIFKMADPDRRD